MTFLRKFFVVACVFLAGFGIAERTTHPAYAIISNGANAIDLIGQYDQTSFTDPVPIYNKGTAQDVPNRFGYSSPTDVLLDTVNHRLFVNESTNARVLVYNLNANNTLPNDVADNVIGQPNFYTATSVTSQPGLDFPQGLAFDSTNNRLYVVDPTGTRVTVYDTSTITNGENAVNVLGQTTFNGNSAALTQYGMSSPYGVLFDSGNNRLYVADELYNRVTVYDTATISNGENAVNVLGPTAFNVTTSTNLQTGMSDPKKLALDSGNNRLYVTDDAYHRVTVYDVSTITNTENAVNVLGQSTFSGTGSAVSQPGMSLPTGLAFDSGNNRLYVSDSNNSRVTIYDVSTITNGENAVNVLGQTTFNGSTANATQSGMSLPTGLAFDSGNNRLYVADDNYNRVQVYDTATLANGENAVDILGEYDETNFTDPVPIYSKVAANNAPNRFGLSQPYDVTVDIDNHRLFVSEALNNRVLVYTLNTDNTLPNDVADNVLGQPNFYTATLATTQPGMRSPHSLAFDSTNNRLYVVGNYSNRVTIYDVSSITNGENAVNVLGQSTFSATLAATTQAGLSSPEKLTIDSTNNRLYVADESNNRVIVYDVSTITNGENAINVLGQAAFNTSTAATTQSGLSAPHGVRVDSTNNRLYVSEITNNRVIIHNVSTITNNQNAMNVIGQSAFNTATAANTQPGLSSPRGVTIDSTNNRLYVVGNGNNRVTIYDVSSITNGENAVNVLGQSTFSGSAESLSQNGVRSPQGIAIDTTNSRLYLTDITDNRILVYDVSTGVSISGTVYTDEGVTNIGANKTVAVSINGAAAAATAETNASGAYTMSSLAVSAGDVLTLYLDDETQDAVTVTVASGVNQTGVDLYQNHLNTRCDNASCSLTNANLETAETNGDSDIAAIYSVTSSNLTMESSHELFIPSSHTYAPGGNVTASTFDVRGTYATSSISYGTIALAGTSTQQTATITNTGNRNMDATVAADGGMVCDGRGTITVGQVHWSLTNSFAWAAGTALTTSAVNIDNSTAQRTSGVSSTPSYWLLQLPSTGIAGTCTNTLTLTAQADA